MKRYATLALAAIFALSFSATVAAAPEFSGEFVVDNEIDLGADAIDVAGDGADLSFSLSAGEEGIWSLTVDLGSALADDLTVADEDGMVKVVKVEDVNTFGEDIDGAWYGWDDAEEEWKVLSDADAAVAERIIAANGYEWEDTVPAVDVDGAGPGLELGAYKLSITPGPFSLVVVGNEEALETTDLFEFIASTEEPVDPKFQLTTEVAGIGLITEYETEGDDALYVFAKTPVAGIGEFGAALEVADLATDEPGKQFSVDVTSDALGFATLKGGIGFDMDVEEDQDALAFAIGAEAPVIEGLTVNASYKNDGRGVPEDEHVQTIGGGIDYNDGMVTASVESENKGEKDEANTLTLNAAVEYPVIADVFTVKGSFESISDEKAPLVAPADASDYEWDGVAVGDILYGLTTVEASADYVVTDAFSVTPSLKYQSFTFEVEKGDYDGYTDGDEEVTGAITTIGVSGTYKFSESASLKVTLENAAGDAVEYEGDTVLPEVKSTTLTTGFAVSF